MKRKPGDWIITVYAQSANGPGWANQPLWVVVRGIDGVIREECLQPAEQSRDMLVMYGISEAVSGAMRKAVEMQEWEKTAEKQKRRAAK